MKKRNRSTLGFSLVEVTLALGMVVFCLVIIMGLLALGITSTQVSAVQTSATNILTAVVSDLESTQNPLPKNGTSQKSPLYQIVLPAAGTTASATPTTIYIGEDGQVVPSSSGALYRLSVWTTGSTTTQQETLVRLLISWPAPSPYTAAQGSLDNVIAINRT